MCFLNEWIHLKGVKYVQSADTNSHQTFPSPAHPFLASIPEELVSEMEEDWQPRNLCSQCFDAVKSDDGDVKRLALRRKDSPVAMPLGSILVAAGERAIVSKGETTLGTGSVLDLFGLTPFKLMMGHF